MPTPELHDYRASRDRLKDALRLVDRFKEVPLNPFDGNPLVEAWRTSQLNEDVHLRVIKPFRPMPFTFLMAHMERGAVRVTSVPEPVTIQCIAGRFYVTDEAGTKTLVVASGSSSEQGPGSIHIEAGKMYTYEALEEVYNIMKVSSENEQ